MPFWRREKPLHERLAEEGGLTAPEHPPHDTTPRWGESGIHGLHRPKEFDSVVVLEVDDVPGDQIAFVALEDGTLLLESEPDVPEGTLAAFADALEATMTPPYRCLGIRRGERQWAAAAKAIRVAELESDVAGDVIELAVQDGQRTLLVDGARSFGSLPDLEALAGDRDAYVIRADRLDGNLWEVSVSAL